MTKIAMKTKMTTTKIIIMILLFEDYWVGKVSSAVVLLEEVLSMYLGKIR